MSRTARLWAALGINVALAIALVACAGIAHATALVADAGHTRAQAADAAHHEIDFHAGLGGFIKRDDEAFLHQRVEL